MVTVTPLPSADGLIEGVINVRGVAVAVVDLCRHLGISRLDPEPDPHVLLIEHQKRVMGLIVDSVFDVVSLAADQIVRTGQVLPAELGDVSLLLGLAHTGGEMVPVLDPEHLFQPGQASVLAEVVGALDEEE
jgi:purine-binding chemotaxis protein CheW